MCPRVFLSITLHTRLVSVAYILEVSINICFVWPAAQLGGRVMFVPKRVPQDADVLGSDDDVRCL